MRLTSSPCFAVRHLVTGGQTRHWACEFQFIQLDAQKGHTLRGGRTQGHTLRGGPAVSALPASVRGSAGCLGAPVRRLESAGAEPSIVKA